MPIIDGQVFIATEATAGSEQTPAATDLVEIERGQAVFAVQGQTDPIPRDLVRGYLDRPQAATPEQRHWGLSFNTELKCTPDAPDSGDATTYPEIHALLRASGMTMTGDATTVEYEWTPFAGGTATSSTTVVLEQLGDSPNKFTSVGSNFSWTMNGPVGDRVMVSWSGMGGYAQPEALPSLSTATSNEGIPFTRATDFSIGGYAPADGLIVRDWTLSSGIAITPRPSAGSTGRFAWPGVVGRDNAVSGTIVVEALTYASGKIWDRFTGATDPTDLTWTLGTGLGSNTRVVEFTIAAAVFGAPQPQQGMPNLWTIPFVGSSEASDDSSLLISFT